MIIHVLKNVFSASDIIAAVRDRFGFYGSLCFLTTFPENVFSASDIIDAVRGRFHFYGN